MIPLDPTRSRGREVRARLRSLVHDDAVADQARSSLPAPGPSRSVLSWPDGSWSDGSWSDGSWSDGSWSDGSWSDGSWSDGSRGDGSRGDGSGPDPSRAGPPFGDALAIAAQRYADAHGVLPGPERAPTRVRWRPSVRTALAGSVAIVLVAGAVALRTVVTQPGEPVDLPVPAPLTAAPATPSGAAGSAGVEADGSASQAPQEVVVDVAGAVAHPGVVRLPVGARVVDAIDAAGGATADADLARLNLARVLVDAEQVLVPRPGDPLPVGPSPGSGAATGAGAGDDLVDLNAADAAALETLPGIGPVLAERIVEHRADRPFSSVDELVDVPGIGTALLERLRDRVRV